MGNNFHTAYSSVAPKTAFTVAAMGAPLITLDRAITYQQGKIIITCDGTVTWANGSLVWSDTMHIYFTSAAGIAIHNSVAVGDIAVTDTYYAYVTLSETNDDVLTVSEAVITPDSASTYFVYNVCLLGYRSADIFYAMGLISCMTSTGQAYQAAPNDETTGAVTLTLAKLLTKIITGTPNDARAYTLDTGANMDATSIFNIDSSFDWTLQNNATDADDHIITVTGDTGHTIIGNPLVYPYRATNFYNSTGLFRTKKTAANTFITYRIS